MYSYQRTGQDVVGKSIQPQHGPVQSNRQWRKIVLTHPARDKGGQRQPEQQMQIGPQDATIDVPDQLKQMVMIVPVDTQKHKTQDVAQNFWQEWAQCLEVSALWHFEFQHHDGNNNRDYAIAESFESSFTHLQ